MTSLLFQILLISGMLESHNSYMYNVTVQVSDSGLDDPSCVQNGSKPCNTLTYALDQISRLRLNSDIDVTVIVTCNQTITSSSKYSFDTFYSLSVKVIGKYHPFIIFNRSFTLSVSSHLRILNWAWVGLGFIEHPGADITKMSQYQINSLSILDCKIMINEWLSTNTQKLSIANTEFGQVNTCPTLTVSTTDANVNTIFIFTNNTFSDCYHYSIDKPILYFNTGPSFLKLTIMNSTFTGLKGRTWNSFVTTGMHKKTHKYQSNALPKHSKIISANTGASLLLVINNSRFIGNKQLILISIHDFKTIFLHDKIMKLHIYGTVMRNNTATSLLVEFKRHYHDYLMVVILKHLSVDGNIVGNTQWDYAVPIHDLETSILNLSMVDQVSIEDSSFSHNQGTPLTFKPNNKKMQLSLNGEIHFTNNTGVMGGACNLYNVHIVIETKAEVNVIFEENTGVYGGALYLDDITISDSKCKLKVKFANNFATISGNSVYFATTPQKKFLITAHLIIYALWTLALQHLTWYLRKILFH